MSQYPPSPYQPPPAPPPNLSFDYYRPAAPGGAPGGAPGDLLAPAKRSSVMMFVLGGLTLLVGASLGLMAATNPFDKLPPEEMEPIRQAEAQVGMPVRTMLVVCCVIMAVGGVAFIALGAWVRRGGSGAVITSLVVTALTTLWLGANVATAVTQIGSNPPMAMSACVLLVATCPFVLLLVWLLQAAKAATALAAAAQHGQFPQQQQQVYAQGANPYDPYRGYPGKAYPPIQPQQTVGYGYGRAASPPQQAAGAKADDQAPGESRPPG